MPRLALPRSGRHTRGVTLPELMVAISGIGIVMAVLLPSVAIFREATRKVECANKITRLAKGMSAFDTSRGQLPGWRNTVEAYTMAHVPKNGNPKESIACVSWTVPLMPFIGELEVSNWYTAYTPSGRDDVRGKQIDLFICPVVAEQLKTPSGLCYFVNGGTGGVPTEDDGLDATKPDHTILQNPADGVCVDTAGNESSQPWFLRWGGRYEYYPARSTLMNVTEGDGSSNTLLFTERTGPTTPMTTSWADNPVPPAKGNGCRPDGTMHTVLHSKGIHPGYGAPGGGESLHATMNTWMKERGDRDLRYPSSRHPDGFMAAFCDGHVRLVSNEIDEWVYTQMLSSDSRRVSYRVGMFQQIHDDPRKEGTPYLFNVRDLGGSAM